MNNPSVMPTGEFVLMLTSGVVLPSLFAAALKMAGYPWRFCAQIAGFSIFVLVPTFVFVYLGTRV